MDHHFNIAIAEKYGIEEAILINHLFYWIKKNEADDHNFFEGRYWTYSSASALSKLFPYIKRATISRKLAKLEEIGIIKRGNFNKSAYDRTMWYAFTDEAMEYLEDMGYTFCKIENAKPKSSNPFCKMRNGDSHNETTIPDKRTNNKTDIQYRGENEFSPHPQATERYDDGVQNVTGSDEYKEIGVMDASLFPEDKREKVAQKREKGTSEGKKVLFADSKYYDLEEFEKCFQSPEFADVDIVAYYHKVADWSSSGLNKKADWIATARNWMRKDKEAGKLQTIKKESFEMDEGMKFYLNL